MDAGQHQHPPLPVAARGCAAACGGGHVDPILGLPCDVRQDPLEGGALEVVKGSNGQRVLPREGCSTRNGAGTQRRRRGKAVRRLAAAPLQLRLLAAQRMQVRPAAAYP